VYAKNGFVEEAMRLLECLYLRRGDVCYSEDVIAALLSAMKLLFCNLPSLYQIE
jgi:hypothetical protein